VTQHDQAAKRWRESIGQLNAWKRGGQRAVHKPLLTLLLVARAEQGLEPRLEFSAIQERLAVLLREFGPPRKSVHPEYPFWHLQTDGYWQVEDANQFPMKKGGYSPPKSELLRRDAAGAVPPDYWSALCEDPLLRGEITSALLDSFWPPTLHGLIRQAIGLQEPDEMRTASRKKRRRDPEFRDSVLMAYEHRCGVCGYDGRLEMIDLALDAAHVRWHAEGGPDEVSNAVALCSFHHVALDRGALGLTEDYRILISQHVHGGSRVVELLVRFHGERLHAPQAGYEKPTKDHVQWHTKQVFRGPARALT
jgi:putative restriction endonuclease